MGMRKRDGEAVHPGGNLHWRALEEFVLANARADKKRVSVFTGPVFDDAHDFKWDRGRVDMKGFKAPRKFWKGGWTRRNDSHSTRSPNIR